MQDPRIKDLNDQSTTWLIVGLAGFWLGVGFITGPLAWIKGGRLRANYRSMGLPPSGNATGAWIVGIVSTALFLMAFLAIAGVIVMAGAAVAASAP